jgi:TetR/AcrR family transcriptional repressor of nem operon
MVDLIAAGEMTLQATYQRMVGCFIGNLTLEMSAANEPMRAKVAAIFAEWRAVIAQALREAAQSGAIASGDHDRAAQAILAYIEGMILLAKSQNDPALLTRLREGVFALAGLGAASVT